MKNQNSLVWCGFHRWRNG